MTSEFIILKTSVQYSTKFQYIWGCDMSLKYRFYIIYTTLKVISQIHHAEPALDLYRKKLSEIFLVLVFPKFIKPITRAYR